MSRRPDPGAGVGTLGAEDLARLRPLGAALGAAAAGRDLRPSLTPVAGELAGARRVGLLAGTFNPFTSAHAALAEAGHAAGCDRVVLAMAPVSLAKETVERAHPLDRLDWVVAWARSRPWAVVAVASHPLLVDMAEACARMPRQAAGDAAGDRVEGAGEAAGRAARGGDGREPRVALLLGSDKAAQLADPRWYEDPASAYGRLARAAAILVATREGHPLPALPFPTAPLPTPDWTPPRSATEARGAVADGRGLADLVPPEVAGPALRSGAYAPDPAPYLARSRALQALVEAR